MQNALIDDNEFALLFRTAFLNPATKWGRRDAWRAQRSSITATSISQRKWRVLAVSVLSGPRTNVVSVRWTALPVGRVRRRNWNPQPL